MNFFKSKAQRIFFVLTIIGVLIFAIRLVIWLNINGHNIYNVTKDIPNAWTPRSSQSRISIIENHTACKWVAKKPRAITVNDAKVMAEDTLYALSDSCLSGLKRLKNSNDLIFITNGYELIQFELSSASNFSNDEPFSSSGEYGYFDYVENQSRLLSPISGFTINKIQAKKCLITKPLWCIEKSNNTYINATKIFLQDFYFKIGLFLIAIGFLGTFFSFVFFKLWKLTLGKLYNWVKSGN